MAHRYTWTVAFIGLVAALGFAGLLPAHAAKSDSYMCEQINMSVDSDGGCRAVGARSKRPNGVIAGCPLEGPQPPKCHCEAPSCGSPKATQSDTAIETITRAMMQSNLGTNLVRTSPKFSDGRLYGCEVTFTAVERDHVYKQGSYIKIEGSFALVDAGKGTLASTLKVVLEDIDLRTATFTPSAPASAYFVSGNSTTKDAVVASTPSGTPGGIFVVLKPVPTLPIIVDGLLKGEVIIAFARRKGGADIQLHIDTRVEGTEKNGQRIRSEKNALEFSECSTSLVKQTLK